MNWTYLLLNLGSLAIPLAFSRSGRFGFGAHWGKAWAAVALSALPFLAWDVWFTRQGVWSFNPRYHLGASFLGLPLEEWLFFLAIPFACLFIYRQYRGTLDPGAAGRGRLSRIRPLFLVATWSAAALFLTAAAFVNAGRAYTLVVCLLGAATAAFLAFVRPRWSAALLAAVLTQYLPFFLVNGALTALPVVIYSGEAILGLRIGTIPVEDSVYAFILLAWPVAVFEALLGRSLPARDAGEAGPAEAGTEPVSDGESAAAAEAAASGTGHGRGRTVG
jgi:lycopene cyclase domain-containing protein